jgi:hypothetical protein
MSDPRDANPENLASGEPSEPARQNVVAGQPASEPAAGGQQSTAASDPQTRGGTKKPQDGDDTIKNTVPNIR